MTALELARAHLLHASMPRIRRDWERDRAAGRTGLVYVVVDLDDARAPALCDDDHDGIRVTRAQAGREEVAWRVRAIEPAEGFLRMLDERHRGPAAREAARGSLVVVALAGNEGYAFVVEQFVPLT